MVRIIKEHIGFYVVVILAFFSVISLFHSGLPPTHDGEYHVVRFYEFDKALRDGNLYPLWAADLNYTFGSPLFNYVYPLPNYVASFFHLFGFSFIDAFKLNLIVASFVGAISAYLFGSYKFGRWGGVLVSVFYTFAPYHFLDIYIRGSVGEVWALALFPLCLYFLDRVVLKKSLVSVLIFGISYSLIIFSHNILAVMFSVFAASYSLLLVLQTKNKRRAGLSITLGFIVGLLLSSVFIFPALLEQKYVVGLKVFDVANQFPELFQLLIPSWGSGFSGGGLENQMSFQVGIANLAVVIVSFISLFKIKNVEMKSLIGLCLFWFVILFFLMTPYSIKIWEKILVMNYFQFPWRLLSLLILCTAILAGSLVKMFKRKIVYIFFSVFLVVTTFSYAKAPYFLQRNDEYYSTRPNFIYGTNSIGNVFQTKWLSQQNALPKEKAYLLKSGQSVNPIFLSSTLQKYNVTLDTPDTLVFNTAYFPGWTIIQSNKKLVTQNYKGKIAVDLESGQHEVLIKLEDTIIRKIGKGISVFTFILVFALISYKILSIKKKKMLQLKNEYRNR